MTLSFRAEAVRSRRGLYAWAQCLTLLASYAASRRPSTACATESVSKRTRMKAEEYLAKVEQELEKQHPPERRTALERRVVEGNPATEIIQAATEVGADMVVTGTHGQTRLMHFSVAE